jgi:hypothetical protein
MTTFVSDAFTRTHASSWGTADVGGVWTTEADTGIVYGTDGTKAYQTHDGSAGSVLRESLACGSTGVGAREILFSTKPDALPAEGSRNLRMMLRRSGGTVADPYGYYIYVYLSALSGSGSVTCYRNDAVGQTLLASVTGALYSSTTKTWHRLRISGTYPTRLQGKSWLDSDSEPAWQVDVLDSTSDHQVAGLEQAFQAHANSSIGAATMRFDDLLVASIDEPAPAPISVLLYGSPL